MLSALHCCRLLLPACSPAGRVMDSSTGTAHCITHSSPMEALGGKEKSQNVEYSPQAEAFPVTQNAISSDQISSLLEGSRVLPLGEQSSWN